MFRSTKDLRLRTLDLQISRCWDVDTSGRFPSRRIDVYSVQGHWQERRFAVRTNRTLMFLPRAEQQRMSIGLVVTNSLSRRRP